MNKSRRAFFSLLGAAPLGVVATVAKASKPDDQITVNAWGGLNNIPGVYEPQEFYPHEIARAEWIDVNMLDNQDGWINIFLKDGRCTSSELLQQQNIYKLLAELRDAGVEVRHWRSEWHNEYVKKYGKFV